MLGAHVADTFLIGQSSTSTTTATADTDEADERPNRPTFRGCFFRYSAEWAYYGAKKSIGAVRG